ncbi:ABC transporter permease [Thermospira aquatica]|uniref:ABC transporter permease n=1 Tax=Thermospira aquatica TaxID=2828656 RepID=A0AAX3BFR1_9SPIR|nr:FtsX-like permease family protein [Thermospira aquatica]URA11005.1 ABC transporter permease [Thermospira aquatica]
MKKILKVWKLAWRNVLRNKRRSLLSAAVLVMGVSALVVFGGYIEAVYYYLGNSVIAQKGHFQVARKGYWEGEEESLALALTPEDQKTIQEILKKKGGVRVLTGRLSASGILGNQERSTIFVGYGVDPEKELDLLQMVGYGGANLSVLLQDQTIILGKILARQMGLGPGDMVTLMSMSEGGSLEAVYVRVGDVLSTGVTAVDSRIVIANLTTMKELLYTPKLHTMVALLDESFSRGDVERYVRELSQELKNQGLGYEVRIWYNLDDTYLPTMRMLQTTFTIITIIFLVVIGFTIVNTMYMAVMERVSEVGTLRAIGTSPKMLFGMFVTEGALISIVATAVGVVVGIVLIVVLNRMNIMLPPYPGQSESYPLVFKLSVGVVVWASVFNILGAVVASMIPARKALKFRIVEALRHV